MLDNLKKHYKDAMTLTYEATNLDYEWFRTELGQTFGILKASISEKERELLISLFQLITPTFEDSYTNVERKWFDYLFLQTSHPSPLSSDQSTIRFYYFFLKQSIDDKQNFEEAVHGIINSNLVIWLSLSHGIIIDESPSNTFEIDSLKDLTDTLTTDLYVEPYLYIGQLQKNDDDLKDKFTLEHTCFQTLHQYAHQEKALTFYEAFPLLIFVSPASIQKGILSNHLVEAINDKETLHTIEAFLQSNLNASSTAKRLFIHRNSLQYRLEKLLEKTGLDIRNFSNAVFLFLAIILMQHK
ncbi:PucR family transcriptional regulator [Metabacillus malikii]|uniref:PucR C-terminal helix-turn-helix domain-containing protein n=1 Tax=Metabacillus malikii TaxID=1504265 RepID=A0ABT9ZJA0_9BACI|nr:helix-turn-helix domain-containing protein [Metabacillus malikii]MDQ0232337.1 hypothetical protein [Metabacillus malikii]